MAYYDKNSKVNSQLECMPAPLGNQLGTMFLEESGYVKLNEIIQSSPEREQALVSSSFSYKKLSIDWKCIHNINTGSIMPEKVRNN